MKLTTLLFIAFITLSSVSYAQDFSEISNLLEEKKQDFNGHLIMLVNKGDSSVFNYQAGLANKDTRVGIASASKWVSTSVILSLVDEGYLLLDDSIGKYLPVFTKCGKGHPTIRQCLTHTSGFPAFANIESKNLSLAQIVDSMAKYVPLKGVPGQQFQYGEMSYRIVGRIAEIVTGKSWEEVFQANIAMKCAMTNTTYCWEKNNPAPGSGVCSTPQDYLNFLKMISDNGVFNGKTVLSANAVSEFHKSQLSGEVQKMLVNTNPEIKYLTDGRPVSYGLGTWIFDYNENKEFQSQIFCPGALGTFPFLDSCKNIYGILLCNTRMEKVISTELKVISLLKEQLKIDCE